MASYTGKHIYNIQEKFVAQQESSIDPAWYLSPTASFSH
jgi:hypothetical protein